MPAACAVKPFHPRKESEQRAGGASVNILCGRSFSDGSPSRARGGCAIGKICAFERTRLFGRVRRTFVEIGPAISL